MRRVLWLVLAVCVACLTHAVAQQRSDFDSLIADADKAMAEQQVDRAAALYESIHTTARDQRDEFWQARGRLGLGKVARSRGQYDRAREHLVAALQTFERLHSTSFVGAAAEALGGMEYSLGNDRSSREYYQKAVEAFESAGDRVGRARAGLGRLIGSGTRDIETRLRTYGELLVVAQSAHDDGLEAAILHSWGDWLFRNGEYDRATEKLELAVWASEKARDLEQLARIYTSLGRMYRIHGQPRAAVNYQLKSLELAERSSASPRTLVQSLNAVGVAYEALGDYDRAGKYYERALTHAETVGSDAIVDFIRAELGGHYVFTEDFERARVLLEAVVARGIDQHPAVRYGQLSRAYYYLGRFEDARAAARRSLELCAAESSLDCVYARLWIAQADLALGRNADALAGQEEALKSLEDLHRKLVPTDFLKQEFFHFWEPLYSLGIEVHVRRNEFREALETAELARSRGFVDLLASHGLTDAPKTVAPLTALSLRGGSTTIRSETAVDAPDANALQALAARLHSTMVEYWVASDRVYIWTIAPGGAIHGASVRLAQAKLVQLIRAASPFASSGSVGNNSRQVISRGNGAIALASRENPAWRELYDQLIKPIESELPHQAGALITIVPHGPLLHLPFAALRDPQGRYLVERYAIHSVPAAAILQFTTERRHADARSGSVLLVADPAVLPKIPGEDPLPRLPGSAEEVRAIARMVPSSRRTLLEGANATDVRVGEALGRHAVVHFATHAIVRDADPMASFLALSIGGGDGRLTAQKIYGLPLDADLVVLSACRSGDGMITGDGIAGLARAFFYAGAASIVVSVWDVVDAPTSRMLPTFYRAWFAGSDKARALRTAQLELIRDLRAGRVVVNTAAGAIAVPEDPAFWAGFVLLGEPN
jgi:CHAT domain-containing protein/tetratricopeptide (TPR) repeat protein